MPLDQFGLLFIEPGQLAAGIAIGTQQLVELGVDRLGIAMLGSLNY
jgi:hypothetical protein